MNKPVLRDWREQDERLAEFVDVIKNSDLNVLKWDFWGEDGGSHKISFDVLAKMIRADGRYLGLYNSRLCAKIVLSLPDRMQLVSDKIVTAFQKIILGFEDRLSFIEEQQEFIEEQENIIKSLEDKIEGFENERLLVEKRKEEIVLKAKLEEAHKIINELNNKENILNKKTFEEDKKEEEKKRFR